jgi:X-Pro dipeptidyl-peptidase
VALLLLPAAAHGKVVLENYRVPSVDGSTINVEVARDDAQGPVPVLLTYSPYNTLSENGGNIADGDSWVAKGYARAYADVLGTRASTGCWDYGGAKETQSGVDVVKFLAHQPWANGNVGMIGTSYDGTTANMVAAQGDKVPELKAIVPIAAISRWYGYAYGGGVRYFGNSDSATDEGFDTPLGFDFGFALTVPLPTHEAFAGAATSRVQPCEQLAHTEKGYDRSPDYDDFWVERDYRRHAAGFRAAVLVAHGWQDYNVKQEEGVALFDAIPAENVPLKRLFMTQGTHSSPSGAAWNGLLGDFLGRYLKGEDTGVEDSPVVMTTGRTVDDTGAVSNLPLREEASWPPAGTTDETLWIRRSFDQDVPGVAVPGPGTGETGTLDVAPSGADDVFTYFDTGAATEEISTRDPLNGPGHGYYSLFHKSAPLAASTRLAGSAVLDAHVLGRGGTTLTPVLVDVSPDGTLTTVARGFLNLDYRNGLEKAEPTTDWAHARVVFLPQDFTFPAGHSIGLLLQGSNTVWALPGTPGEVNVGMGGERSSKLLLPIAP